MVHVYESCLAENQHRQPFSVVSRFHASHSLELMHMDLCGLIMPETPGGKRLFLLVVDDKSRYMWLILLASNNQAVAAIIQLQTCLEVVAGKKLGTLCADHGDKFMVQAFADHYADQSVQHHLTTPYMPQQNGVVEQRNQKVLGMARSMMKGMNMPGWL